LSGIKPPNGNWNIEWIVTPLALSAAIPVGATTTVFLCVVFDDFTQLRSFFRFPGFPGLEKIERCVLIDELQCVFGFGGNGFHVA